MTIPKDTPAIDLGKEKLTGFTFRGKEITLGKKRGPNFKGLVVIGEKNGVYSDKKKMQAASLYAVTGDLSKTAEITQIPRWTLSKWRKQGWFHDLLREVWDENNEKVDALFTDIIQKSLVQIQDRLEHGDVKVTKNGQVVRVPVSAKDLSLVSAINVDKRQLLRGLPTSRSESVGAITDRSIGRLEQLAETFENLAKFGRKQTAVIDIETVDALPQPQSTGDAGAGAVIPAQEGNSQGQVPSGER